VRFETSEYTPDEVGIIEEGIKLTKQERFILFKYSVESA